ncbi:6911_t:CDS:2, partial [Funneliformis caledonium]
ATVIFDRQIDKKYIIFTDENIYIKFYDDMVESFLNNPITWYLVNTKPPPYVHAITILTCFPNKTYYKEFHKMLKSTIRYMPIWSGIPRFVLEKAGDSSQDLLLEQAIVSISLEKCLQNVGELDSKEDTSHQILHITTSDYIHTTIQFATTYIAEKRPIAKNFPSFDSLIPSVGLFQITIALNHNIKMVALKEYDKVIENGKIAENIPLWIQNLQQYVMEINIL